MEKFKKRNLRQWKKKNICLSIMLKKRKIQTTYNKSSKCGEDGLKESTSDENDEKVTTFKYDSYPSDGNTVFNEQPKNEKIPPATSIETQSEVKGVNTCTDRSKNNNHMKIHKNKRLECEICKKCFSTNTQLSRHMNSHTGNRPYKCLYCDASFGDPSSKIRHQRIHTNERPYKCDLCNKAYTYSHGLKKHMITHTGEKPHMCEYVVKAFPCFTIKMITKTA